jgi:allantoin racemase
MRILWQGFTHPTVHGPYTERLVAYLGEIADEGTQFEFAGVDPPDRHLHRITELRCAVQAVAQVLEAEDDYDAVVMGHFQDAGLWDARAALDVPVVGLGESAMLYACQLGRRFGLVTIDPIFVPWHEEQVRTYALEQRFAGVRAMTTPVDLYMRVFDDEGAADEVRRQFEEQARPLVEAGAEVLIPAGGLPALLLGRDHAPTVDGALVLNPTAVAAKQAEAAVRLRRLNGTGASRRGTFAKPPPEAVQELLRLAGSRER